MDKKEKDCAYWIAVLLAGVALGSVAGFVFGWLWREGPTSPEATKLIDVFIAVGTVGAVVAAISISFLQRVEAKKIRKSKANIASSALMPRVRFLRNLLNYCLDETQELGTIALKKRRALMDATQQLKEINKITDEQLMAYAEINQRDACILAECREHMLSLFDTSDVFYKNIGGDSFVSLVSFYGEGGVRESLEGIRDKLDKISIYMSDHNQLS